MSTATKLADFKVFAQRTWALARPYFASEDKWKARSLLAAIIALNLAMVYMAVLFNAWNKVFYDALQNKDAAVFWTQLGRFTYLAFSFIVLAVYKFYLTQLLEMRWRGWMTTYYLERWLSNQNFYKLELLRFAGQQGVDTANPDNPDQRIQEDINQFTGYTISLSMGLLNAVVTLASFVGILWGLSGNFEFTLGGQSFNIPGFMVWMAVLYSLAGSVLTHFIGRPQIKLNFNQQRLEADFRHHLVRVREYSEAIALDRGESVERGQLDTRFSKVLGNYLRLIRTRKNLVWFTSFYGQAAVVFPFVVAAPRFFSGAIQLGALMQIASAFGRVQDALSWFVDNYPSLAAWRATTDRLTNFEASFQSIKDLSRQDGALVVVPSAVDQDKRAALSAEQLNIQLPDGAPLLEGAAFNAAPGESILLQGPSGSGKSTLFRTIAGVWPYAQGTVERPMDTMFIPQRPYFPNGPLREALAYPSDPKLYNDESLQEALRRAHLPELVGRLDEVAAWGQTLSGGEQQRLAIARVLLKKPAWVFADEATSAMDERTEEAVYQSLLDHVRDSGGSLVSIAHRPSVARHHQRHWLMQPNGIDGGARYTLQP
jgi:putative ATP-binding cassette transporter